MSQQHPKWGRGQGPQQYGWGPGQQGPGRGQQGWGQPQQGPGHGQQGWGYGQQGAGWGQPQAYAQAVGEAAAEPREKFIVRTYNHLFVAIVVFAAIEFGLFLTGLAEPIAASMLNTSWLLVLGGFLIVGWLASATAHRAQSKGAQYAALLGYVVAEAVIFLPLLVLANYYAPGVIQSAALVTLAGFAGLTGIAFWTRKDFSFLGGILRWGFILALVGIVAAVIFGFNLGTGFSVLMIGLAGGAILYKTSQILHHYPQDRYVAAALELFASIALMFWYVLRIFLAARD